MRVSVCVCVCIYIYGLLTHRVALISEESTHTSKWHTYTDTLTLIEVTYTGRCDIGETHLF